jgi:uncharacterized protein (UPF0332 family)
VKPEVAAHMAKAREILKSAEIIGTSGIWPVAGREAYLATFHAAQAVIFDRRGRTPKTHSGVHSLFGEIAKDEPHLGREMSRFLGQAYKVKAVADYATQESVSEDEAREILVGAHDFLDRCEKALASAL